jgi:hypothetical protein
MVSPDFFRRNVYMAFLGYSNNALLAGIMPDSHALID